MIIATNAGIASRGRRSGEEMSGRGKRVRFAPWCRWVLRLPSGDDRRPNVRRSAEPHPVSPVTTSG